MDRIHTSYKSQGVTPSLEYLISHTFYHREWHNRIKEKMSQTLKYQTWLKKLISTLANNLVLVQLDLNCRFISIMLSKMTIRHILRIIGFWGKTFYRQLLVLKTSLVHFERSRKFCSFFTDVLTKIKFF